MDLALEVGVSPRHLSFVETGRSKPSPELVASIAERSRCRCASGTRCCSPRATRPATASGRSTIPRCGPRRESVQRMLDAHDPYPGVRHRPAVEHRAGQRGGEPRSRSGLPPELLGPPINVYRVCLHPDGLAARDDQLRRMGGLPLGQLQRSLALTGDPALAGAPRRGASRTRTLPTRSIGRRPWRATTSRCWCRCGCEVGDGELSLFTTLTTFGTPQDVTLDELAVELFFPADDATERALRGLDPA